jgi:hypothetical protein
MRALDGAFSASVKALIGRGVNEKSARRLLFGVPDDCDVTSTIEWVDSIIARDPRKFENPAGMYVSFLRDGIAPPASFLSSRRRKELHEAERQRRGAETAQAAKSAEAELRYAEYREEQVNAYVAGLKPDVRAKLVKDAAKAAAKHVSHFDLLTREQQEDLIARFTFNMVVAEIPTLTKEEFEGRDQFRQLSFPSPEGR